MRASPAPRAIGATRAQPENDETERDDNQQHAAEMAEQFARPAKDEAADQRVRDEVMPVAHSAPERSAREQRRKV